MRILEQMLAPDATDVGLAGPEHHGCDIDDHLVDESCREDLAADSSGVHGDRSLARQLPGLRDGRARVIDEVAGRFRMPAGGLGPVRDHDHMIARG
jgi:hypothetical protein